MRSNLIISTGESDDNVEDVDYLLITSELRNFVIEPVHHNQRLDLALADLVPELSRSYLQQLVSIGAVFVRGILKNKASTKLKAGDLCTIEIRPTPQSQAFKPEKISLDIVFEDEHLMVINKPVGLVVHPAPGNWSGTLLNGLLAHDKVFKDLPRAGIVHRLDKDTSGLMVVAKSRGVMNELIKSIAAREVHREYLALAHHAWSGPPCKVVEASIGRDPRNRLRMAVVDLTRSPGKIAKTEFSVLSSVELGSLVKCTLHTGRTHQIRVHMASISHPLVGDSLYGGKSVGVMTRQALHAYRLAFRHPVKQELLTFNAQMPFDLLSALDFWNLSYNKI